VETITIGAVTRAFAGLVTFISTVATCLVLGKSFPLGVLDRTCVVLVNVIPTGEAYTKVTQANAFLGYTSRP
jgi:hypothetical protein